MSPSPSFRSAVRLVALLNLAYFAVEMTAALRIGSVSLLADSVDFFEDAAVNFLILAALGWSATRRAKVGTVLAAILLAPAVAFLWTLWRKLGDPAAGAPDPGRHRPGRPGGQPRLRLRPGPSPRRGGQPVQGRLPVGAQ